METSRQKCKEVLSNLPWETFIRLEVARRDNKMVAVEGCTPTDITLSQSPTEKLPSGIPTYTVEITNECTSGPCAIFNIHVSCGSFASAILINPDIFRRLAIDDCLVNNGQPLQPGVTLSFKYATTFSYNLSVKNFLC
ncbi:hypothetical protein L1049_027679 [Liquidambar formosana]|uniref:Uncharacterized protein n=1 Tax=Liquidambar formosana TaxID=63359 RepID=A0AAP0RHN8_LIQFO